MLTLCGSCKNRRSSETSVLIRTTRRNIPEDDILNIKIYSLVCKMEKWPLLCIWHWVYDLKNSLMAVKQFDSQGWLRCMEFVDFWTMWFPNAPVPPPEENHRVHISSTLSACLIHKINKWRVVLTALLQAGRSRVRDLMRWINSFNLPNPSSFTGT
jgi:hypothetical protein